jgi:hypothetical protein
MVCFELDIKDMGAWWRNFIAAGINIVYCLQQAHYTARRIIKSIFEIKMTLLLLLIRRSRLPSFS